MGAGAEAGVDGSSPGDNGVSEEARAAAAAAAATDARRRAANAALARLTASQQRPAAAAGSGSGSGSGSAMVVPTGSPEEVTVGREDEKNEEEQEKEEVEIDLEGLTEVAGDLGGKLLVAAGVRTLGQLADRDEEELAGELAPLQQQQQQQEADGASTVEGAAAAGGSTGTSTSSTGEGDRVSVGQVSEWVQAARGEELDEIMADIVGGDEDVVEVREGCIYRMMQCCGNVVVAIERRELSFSLSATDDENTWYCCV